MKSHKAMKKPRYAWSGAPSGQIISCREELWILHFQIKRSGSRFIKRSKKWLYDIFYKCAWLRKSQTTSILELVPNFHRPVCRKLKVGSRRSRQLHNVLVQSAVCQEWKWEDKNFGAYIETREKEKTYCVIKILLMRNADTTEWWVWIRNIDECTSIA